MVSFAPISQVGCLSASFAVTFSSSLSVLPKKGPPEAVRMIFLIAFLFGIPCIDWKIAECSLSTGRIWTPFSFAKFVTRWPPATSVSLFARAKVFFALIASRVGWRPTIPTTEFKTVSALSYVAHSISPSIPQTTFVFVSLIFALSSFAAVSLIIQTISGLNLRICSSIISTFELAVRHFTS